MVATAAEIEALKPNVRKATKLMKLLASENRMMILCRLSEGEAKVSDLAEYLGQTISSTSQHLAKMRAEELVDTRRDAQTIYYRISDPAVSSVIETLCRLYR